MPSVSPAASGSAAPATGSPSRTTAWLERWFLRLAIGIGAAGWLALLLAEIGQLHLSLLAALLVAAVVGIAVQTRRGRGAASAPAVAPFSLKGAAGLLAVAALGGALYFPAYDSFIFGDDASAYLGLGREIAGAGRLTFDDPLLGEIPLDAREDLFLNRQRDWSSLHGSHVRFPGGFLIADIEKPEVSTGFSPLFPVLAALFYEAMPESGAPPVTPLFAVLAVAGLFLLGASVGGARAGLLAALLLAVSLPQIWFARYPVPDVVAQFFVVAGLLALLAAFRDDRPWLAAAAGGLFGMACFAKVDMIIMLLVSLTAFCAWWVLVRPARGGRCCAWLLAACGVMLAHNVAHYLLFPSDYTRYLEDLLSRSYLLHLLTESLVAMALAGLGLLATAAAAFSIFRRHGARGAGTVRAGGIALLGLLAAHAVNYAFTTPGRFPDTIFWLGWYLSWPVVALCAMALVWLLRSGRVGSANPGLTFLLVLVGVVSLHYLYDPLEDGDHIWSMRRFVPVVLPGLLLILATGAGRLIERIYVEYRTAATVATGLVLVALVGGPSVPVAGAPVWEGALHRTAELARGFPADAVVLVSPELAGTHLQTALAYQHGVDTVLVQERRPGAALRHVVDGWLERGRPVFVVAGNQGFSFPAPHLVLSNRRAMRIDVTTLERTFDRLPRELVDNGVDLQILEAVRADDGGMPARTAVNIGNPADDIVSNLDGFYAAEQDEAAGPYRWTREVASFAIPAGERLMLVVAGGRPAGAAEAEISVWAGSRQIADRLTVDNQPQAITLDIPPAENGEPTELLIRSSTFQPQAAGVSPDSRNLGIRVYRADILPDAPEQPDPEDAATPEAPPAAGR